MLARASVIALNTYREAVRARILHGLFGLALVTLGYAMVVGAYALKNQNRVVADLGSASISVYAVIVSVMLGATSLYRELELKTIFPILARPIRRGEYLVGKFFGILLTIVVFVFANAGLLLFALAVQSGKSLIDSVVVPMFILLGAVLLGFKVVRLRTWLPVPVSLLLFLLGAKSADVAALDRSVIVGQAVLSLFEVSVVTALSMLFTSFSSPFLTAIFTLSVFVVGRSADTLSRLPARVFGEFVHDLGVVLSRVFPNLMVYVPPRAFFTGEAIGVSYYPYMVSAFLQAILWSVGLLLVSSLIFRRRDFL